MDSRSLTLVIYGLFVALTVRLLLKCLSDYLEEKDRLAKEDDLAQIEDQERFWNKGKR